jgi:hypothetical protein
LWRFVSQGRVVMRDGVHRIVCRRFKSTRQEARGTLALPIDASLWQGLLIRRICRRPQRRPYGRARMARRRLALPRSAKRCLS